MKLGDETVNCTLIIILQDNKSGDLLRGKIYEAFSFEN
jgi:hypothetical protein